MKGMSTLSIVVMLLSLMENAFAQAEQSQNIRLNELINLPFKEGHLTSETIQKLSVSCDKGSCLDI